MLWKPGYHENTRNIQDNPIMNISSKTTYTISSARSVAGPFKDKDDHVKISMESSGVTKKIETDNEYDNRGVLPNSKFYQSKD